MSLLKPTLDYGDFKDRQLRSRSRGVGHAPQNSAVGGPFWLVGREPLGAGIQRSYPFFFGPNLKAKQVGENGGQRTSTGKRGAKLLGRNKGEKISRGTGGKRSLPF